MNINTNIVDHPQFKWMPGMLASDEQDRSGLMHRIISVERFAGGPLVQTCTNGGSPGAIGLVAVDLDDPATIGCLMHPDGMDWSMTKIRRIALGTYPKGGA
jgi:hypothetical protein